METENWSCSGCRIFIVEDDDSLVRLISNRLEAWDFEVRVVNDWENLLNEIMVFNPHLVLMDISLPRYDGFYFCSELRKSSVVPVLFISARNGTMDKVMAVTKGGDDFLTKPFDNELLLAKIQALLRRTYAYQETASEILEHPKISVDLKKGTAKGNRGSVELTKNELRILSCLIKARGAVVSRNGIMDELWSSDTFVDDNTLTVNINRLRRKLDTICEDGLITTIKGQGYKIG